MPNYLMLQINSIQALNTPGLNLLTQLGTRRQAVQKSDWQLILLSRTLNEL